MQRLNRLNQLLTVTALGLLGALSISTFASTVSAQPSSPSQDSTRTARAIELYKEGVALYDARDYAAAVVVFQQAYEQAPNYRVLYNIALCRLRLQQDLEAFETLNRYLTAGGDEITEERRSEVLAEIDRLKSRIARLLVRSNVDGAEVLVDGIKRGTTPLEAPVLVAVGRRQISVRAHGRVPVTRTVEAGPRAELDLTIELEPIPTPVERPAKKPKAVRSIEPPPKKEAQSNTPVWVLGTTAGVFLVGAGVTGLLAVDAKNSLDDELDRYPADPAAVEDARSRTRTLLLLTDILGIASLAAGTATLIVVTFGSNDDAMQDVSRLEIGVRPTGLGARYRF